MKKPLISILVPVHNSASNLEECIKSIKKQSFRNLEIIALDDFSSDKSYSMLRKLKKREKRLRIYRNIKRYGIAVTMNRLLAKAKGDFLAFADTDDIFTKNKLKAQLEFLIKNPQIAAVGTQCIFIDEKGRKIGRSKFPLDNENINQNPLHGISMQLETVLINKKLLPKDILKFETDSGPFLYSSIFIKILPYGKLANLKTALYYHRRHPQTYLTDIKRNIFSLIKLFIKSKALYENQSPIRSFFSPLIKSV
ncbi:MAG: hypothetical protein COU25_01515 [Candidatus Levybacteria bacterium CG10_big_fil_rev_8_21_14_0_10_35_13]|nr:MAG: hypothetical protein COU25_01515 [Candidatus Levybacteria bacterium CG10_big_fil_rev_8_21_14_0_10_35_13]